MKMDEYNKKQNSNGELKKKYLCIFFKNKTNKWTSVNYHLI